RIPTEINEDLVRDIGRAYAAFVRPKRVVVGRDIRLTSATLASALIEGLRSCGVDVYDIGLCGTEGVYFATSLGDDSGPFDGGIMVTASHNPPDYNGLKFVREGSRPISADTGLKDMATMIRDGKLPGRAAKTGALIEFDVRSAYVEHLLSYIDRDVLKPLKVVVNAGNGGAGLFVDLLEPHLPFEFVKLHHTPDGTFPNGVPNPMLEANRLPTIEAIKKSGAQLGLAWDGDFDRCFFFDERGTFVEGYYLVGLLAEPVLEREQGARIVHDPRLTWNTIEIVERLGGKPVLCKSGHAFIKQKMREVDAAYGGEMSAHHYFRRFAYCDTGMVPWLLVLERMSRTGKTLSDLVGERMARFPCSGEINRRVPDGRAAIETVQRQYDPEALSVDFTDGLSMEFAEWRLNLRSSNTEPLIRLNVESRGSRELMQAKTDGVLGLLRDLGAEEADHSAKVAELRSTIS
ncbi:MAG: phosphomannomutase, partial [Gammaproteobacteria bacterium]|nr:phosphomannomutase [Gammaproteobacteria bacterium]